MLSDPDADHIYKLVEDLPSADTYHTGYLDYLLQAWTHDMGIEIAPWHLYYLYLWQIIDMIMTEHEKYIDIFGDTQKDKSVIKVYDQKFDINIFFENLEKINKNYSEFVPTFENPPKFFNECIKGSLSHLAKEYYDISILSCSIPKVEVLGSEQDWKHLHEISFKVYQLLETKMSLKLKEHFLKTLEYFEKCSQHYKDDNYWDNFFIVKKCGSGSQKQIGGNINNILLPTTYLIDKIPMHIAEVKYCFNSQKSVFLSGLLYSKIENGILKPFYHTLNGEVVVEMNDQFEKSAQTKFLEWMKRFDMDNSMNSHSALSDNSLDYYYENKNKFVKIYTLDDALNDIILHMPFPFSTLFENESELNEKEENHNNYPHLLLGIVYL
jgi:hypothetical protein